MFAEKIVLHSGRRSATALLDPLHRLAQRIPQLSAGACGWVDRDGDRYPLPRFVFDGANGAADAIRLAIFAGTHGDEPSGSLAVVRFLGELCNQPGLAAGYRIYAYPVVNPTGFEDNTRHARSGVDLNREFWQGSAEPEVRLIERELWRYPFQGIICLHSDDTSTGVYGFVRGPDLSRELLEPALTAADCFIPRDSRPIIDGFRASRGLIEDCYHGILSAPPDIEQAPFELTFETPSDAPMYCQVRATNAALHAILAAYPAVLSVAQNI
jgi:predicted deacylase